MSLDRWINKVTCADCMDVLREIPDNSVDLVVTDPPYNRGFFAENQITFEFLDECRRVLKEGHNIYCFWSPKDIGNFDKEFQARFQLLNILVFHHRNKIGFTSPFTFEFTFEPVFYGSKGQPTYKVNRYFMKDGFDVWIETMPQASFNGEQYRQHPTQKPIEIMRRAIVASSPYDSIVLDPFLGSGTTAVACKQLGRRFIGIEINPEYCRIAEERLKQEVLPLQEKQPDTEPKQEALIK